MDFNRPVFAMAVLQAPFSLTQWMTVSVLGREEGYTVKYSPPPEEVPEGKARGNKRMTHLTTKKSEKKKKNNEKVEDPA